MFPATFLIIVADLLISPVELTPQEWVRAYAAVGGKAVFNKESGWLGIDISDKTGNGVSPGGLLCPKGVEEIRVSGGGVRNAHVSAVLRWPNTRRLYLHECTALDETVFPIIKNSGLYEIYMYDMQVTAGGVSGLSGAKSIRRINIVTTLTGKYSDLKLINMAQLESISLLNFGITSVVLSDMPKLESIFDSSDLDPKKLRRVEFSNLPLLTKVNFALAPVDKLVVERCKSLEEIWVEKAKLTDMEIANLMRQNPGLKIVRK